MESWKCSKCTGEDDSDIFVESQIIPGHLIGDFMKKPK